MRSLLKLFLLTMLVAFSFYTKAQTNRDFYQITIYHFADSMQLHETEQYISKSYVPFLHAQKEKNVGVFVPIDNDTATDKRLYVIRQLSKLEQALPNSKAPSMTDKDSAFQYPAYKRMESWLLQAFELAPTLNHPKLKADKTQSVYELRSYESASSTLFASKVKMFNQGGEVALFDKLHFNAVFYSTVIAGSHMPNLVYMTSFENMADRDAHWKSFGESPEWKTISGLPEYQHNMNKMDVVFLHATAYSDY